MKTANVYEAKSQLSKLLDAAASGDDVFITRNGVRFQLVPVAASRRGEMFGALANEIEFLPGFDETDTEIADMFHQST